MRRLLFMLIGVMSLSSYAGQMVVVSSGVPLLKLGQVIDGADVLKLEPGQSVTLVSQQGQTIELAGPYEGQPDPGTVGQESLVDSLAGIVAESEKSASLAVFRRAPGKSNPWSIDVEKDGQYCVSGTDATVLKRRKPYTGATLEIVDTQVGKTVTVDWAEGDRTMPWPASLKPRDGAQYRLSLAGQAPVTISLRIVPGDLSTDAHRIVWLSETGCRKQAFALLENL